MGWFEGFDDRRVRVGDVTLRVRSGGRAGAPPLLLLHGFPQTGAMWHRVARQLAPEFRLVIPDLRGYGSSDKPEGARDHANYGKRQMAADVAALMRGLGHERYFVAGHDRGGRVAHRLALDHPDAVRRLSVLDIAPTVDMYAATDVAYATAYWHWFFLIQPAPLPERMIECAGTELLHTALGRWGAHGLRHVEPEALAEYESAFTAAGSAHAMCEDYRASAPGAIDQVHDEASRAAGAKIRCDLLALVGERGVVARMFDAAALWRAQCSARVVLEQLPCGHYLPEEQPDAVTERLRAFFQA